MARTLFEMSSQDTAAVESIDTLVQVEQAKESKLNDVFSGLRRYLIEVLGGMEGTLLLQGRRSNIKSDTAAEGPGGGGWFVR